MRVNKPCCPFCGEPPRYVRVHALVRRSVCRVPKTELLEFTGESRVVRIMLGEETSMQAVLECGGHHSWRCDVLDKEDGLQDDEDE